MTKPPPISGVDGYPLDVLRDPTWRDHLFASPEFMGQFWKRVLAVPTPPADVAARPCTCHPDDDPPVPCAQKYALSDCKAWDTALWALVSTLHSNIEEDKRPVGWCDFSDGQIDRLNKAANAFLRALSPSPAVAAEPVAFRYKFKVDGDWFLTIHPIKDRFGIEIIEPLYASPPVMGGRETFYHILSHSIPSDMIDSIWQELKEAGVA